MTRGQANPSLEATAPSALGSISNPAFDAVEA